MEGLGYKDGFSMKLEELTRWMLYANVGILCMQETHAKQSAHFLYNDFLVILSGSEGASPSYAGVGFLVAPHLRRSVVGLLQFSDRLASLRVRVSGGQACFVTAYAPTNQKDFETRHAFYTQAHDFIQSQRVHGPTFAVGDFNARLHSRQPSEESVLGPGVFGDPWRVLDPTANRELLLELCTSLENVVANTWYDQPDDFMVTYRNFGVDPLDVISPTKFAQLDHILAPITWIEAVLCIYSDRTAPLRT